MDKVKIRLRKNECMTLLTVKLVKTLEQGIHSPNVSVKSLISDYIEMV